MTASLTKVSDGTAWDNPASIDPELWIISPDGYVYGNLARSDDRPDVDRNATITNATLPLTGLYFISAMTSHGTGQYRLTFDVTNQAAAPVGTRAVATYDRDTFINLNQTFAPGFLMLDPRGYPISGADVTLAAVSDSENRGVLALDNSLVSTTASGIAYTNARFTTAGRVQLTATFGQTLFQQAVARPDNDGRVALLMGVVEPDKPIERFRPVAHVPIHVFDATPEGDLELKGPENGLFRLPVPKAADRYETVTTKAGESRRALGANDSKKTEDAGDVVDDLSLAAIPLPTVRQALTASSCQGGKLTVAGGSTSPAPYTFTLSDISAPTGGGSPVGLLNRSDGIKRHRIEKEIRLRLDVKDKDGNVATGPVLVSVYLGGARKGALVFDPDGARRAVCSDSITFLWHDRDAQGNLIPNEEFGYQLGTLSTFLGISSGQAVWGETESLSVRITYVTAANVPLTDAADYPVRPEPGKPTHFGAFYNGAPKPDTFRFWTGSLRVDDGSKTIGTGTKYRSNVYNNYNAWWLFDQYDNQTYGYTATRFTSPSVNVHMGYVQQGVLSFLDSSASAYRLSTFWDNDPDWPLGSQIATLYVDYPADPDLDWPAGTVSKPITYQFEGGSSKAVIKHTSYDLLRPDGTAGVNDDGRDQNAINRPFPFMARPGATTATLPKTEVGDVPRLALLLVEGDHTSGVVPQPEPISTGTRIWSSSIPPGNLLRTDPQPVLDVNNTASFRLTLVDDAGVVAPDGEFLVHRCPRIDHEPSRNVPCTAAPVRSVNGTIDNLSVNPNGGGTDSRGYMGLELTIAPQYTGIFYVKVESLGRDYRLRRQADLITSDDVTLGEWEGAFALANVGYYGELSSVCTRCPENAQGSPVYVAQGIYETGATDLALPTPSGLPLAVSRTYLSGYGVEGAGGHGWRFSFTSRIEYKSTGGGGKTLTLTMPDGKVHSFGRGSTANTFKRPAGFPESTLTRRGDGAYELIFEDRTTMAFRTDGQLAQVIDEYGNTLTYTYDANNHVARMQESLSGRYIDVIWNGTGKVDHLLDSAGRTVYYGYDQNGLLSTVTDPMGHVTHLEWIQGKYAQLLTGIKDNWNRPITQISYDLADRVKTYTAADQTYTYNYRSVSNAEKTDADGRTYSYTLNPEGLITSRSGAGNLQTSQYDGEGRVVSRGDYTGAQTNLQYDAEGRVQNVTNDAAGAQRVRFDYSYDPTWKDKPTTVTPINPATNQPDDRWNAFRYEYQATGMAGGAPRKVYRKNGTGEDLLATYDYDQNGRLKSTTAPSPANPAGVTTDVTYDSTGNLATVTAPAHDDLGSRALTSYGYDNLGRPLTATDARGKITRYDYDPLGRPTRVELPKPTAGSPNTYAATYTYDNFDAATGLVFTHVTDPNGRVTKMGHDQHGRLLKTIDPQGKATSYAYNKNHLSSMTDPNGNVTQYAYDASGRPQTTTHPDGKQESFTYRTDGSVNTMTDRKGRSFRLEYDGHKRLVKKTDLTSNKAITYTYDGGKLTTIYDETTTPTETHSFSYDSALRLASVTQANRGTINYTYHPDDSVATVQIVGGPTTTYSYYPNGAMKDIAWSPVAGNFSYSYLPTGQYQNLNLPNGQTRAFSYDDQGRLTQIANAKGATNIATFAYGYDTDHATGQQTVLGQRTSMTADFPAMGLANAQTKYLYDPLNQLTEVRYPTGSVFNGEVHAWTYDDLGNRTTANGGAYTYLKNGTNQQNGQRLLSDGTNTYGYDFNGNNATRTGPGLNLTFGYDAYDRMASIAGDTNATYTYDYDGRRSSKTVNGVTTTYIYRGVDLIGETSSGQTSYFLNGQGVDELLAVSKTGSTFFPSVDGLGSVVATTDGTGAVLHGVVFDAWGNTKAETGTRIHPFTYTGREVGEVGFLFYRARFYQPGLGRFGAEDPLRLAAGHNSLFGYVGGNPINFVDPTGLVDINLIPREETSTRARYKYLESGDDEFTVGAHGNEVGMMKNHKLISAEWLALRIRRSGKWKEGMVVKLYSCHMGRGYNGKKAFAQLLANLLHTTVWAPDGPIEIDWRSKINFKFVYTRYDDKVLSVDTKWLPFIPEAIVQ